MSKAKRDLFLIEFYTNDGDINFAWVRAVDADAAEIRLMNELDHVASIIDVGQQNAIVPLAGDFRVNTPDANLFIIG
jgi:hypothetical protein